MQLGASGGHGAAARTLQGLVADALGSSLWVCTALGARGLGHWAASPLAFPLVFPPYFYACSAARNKRPCAPLRNARPAPAENSVVARGAMRGREGGGQGAVRPAGRDIQRSAAQLGARNSDEDFTDCERERVGPKM